MRPPAFCVAPLAWLLLCFAATARAAMAPDVEVTAVHFNSVRHPFGAPGDWLEASVALTVRPPPGSPGQMLARVRVSLLLGFELPAPAGGERRLEHYRAEAECVALEAGRAEVRFYLPPEALRRDRAPGDPRYWGVELTAGGRAVPAGRAAYATTLAGAEQRRNFQARGSAAAAVNDGILLPQYLTPFVHEYPRATPAFVRREAR